MNQSNSKLAHSPLLALSLVSLGCVASNDQEIERNNAVAEFSSYSNLISERESLENQEVILHSLRKELDTKIDELGANIALSALSLSGILPQTWIAPTPYEELFNSIEADFSAHLQLEKQHAFFDLSEQKLFKREQTTEQNIRANTAKAEAALSKLLRLPEGWSVIIPPIPEENWSSVSNPFYSRSADEPGNGSHEWLSPAYQRLEVQLIGPQPLDYPITLEITSDGVRVDLDSVTFLDEKSARERTAEECHVSKAGFASAYPLSSLPAVLERVAITLDNLDLRGGRLTELQLFEGNSSATPPTVLLRPGIISKDNETTSYANLTGLIDLPLEAQRTGKLPSVVCLKTEDSSELLYLSEVDREVFNMITPIEEPSSTLTAKIAQIHAARDALSDNGSWHLNLHYYFDDRIRVDMTRNSNSSNSGQQSEDLSIEVIPPKEAGAELQYQFGQLTTNAIGAKAISRTIAAVFNPETEIIFSITTSPVDQDFQVIVVSKDSLYERNEFSFGRGPALSLRDSAEAKLFAYHLNENCDVVAADPNPVVGTITEHTSQEEGQQMRWSFSNWTFNTNAEAIVNLKIPHGLMCGTGIWEHPERTLVASGKRVELVGGLVETNLVK